MSKIINSKEDLQLFEEKLKEKIQTPREYTETTLNGEQILEWKLNGLLHSHPNGLPSVIQYYKNGNRKYESWYLYNLLHMSTLKAPARIGYYENGHRMYEEWWLNGEHHRPISEGPAEIWYHENGKIHYKTFYVNGKAVNNPSCILL